MATFNNEIDFGPYWTGVITDGRSYRTITLSGNIPGPTPTPTPTPTQTITPGGSFTGAQGTGFGLAYGSTFPAPSTTIIGSGYDTAPTVHFSAYPGEDVSASTTIVVHARHTDPAGINYVEFTLEGGTSVQVSTMIKHPTINVFGYPIKCNFDGRGILKARVVPYNGVEAIGYVFLRGIASGIPADDITYFVDPVSGSDAANGLTRGTAWKTLTKAMGFNGVLANWNAIEGGNLRLDGQYSIIVCGTGNTTLLWDIGLANPPVSGWSCRNLKKMVIKLDAGTTNVKIGKTTRDHHLWSWTWTEVQGIPFDLTNIASFQYASNGITDWTNPLRGGSYASVASSHIQHPDGAAGPISLGYPKFNPAGETYYTQFFHPQAPWVLAESNFASLNFAGVFHARGCVVTFCQFFEQYDSINQSNGTKIDVRATQIAQQETRAHDLYELTVASIATNTPIAGQSTITLSGAPTIVNDLAAKEIYLRFVSGAAVGQGGKTQGAGLTYYRMLPDGSKDLSTTYSYPPNADGSVTFNTVGFKVVSQDNTAKTIVITGLPTGVVATDLIRTYYVGHPDVNEIIGTLETSGQIENVAWINTKVVGPTLTAPFLVQSYTVSASVGESITVSTTGTTITSYSGTSLRPKDFIRNTATGEYQQVKTASGGTGTLYTAFAANLVGATCSMSRGPNRWAFTNFICHKVSVDATPGDWGFGGADFLMGPCSIIGKRDAAAGELVTFGTDNGKSSTALACFALRNMTWGSSIVSGFLTAGLEVIFLDLCLPILTSINAMGQNLEEPRQKVRRLFRVIFPRIYPQAEFPNSPVLLRCFNVRGILMEM
jgi:hypothetical protein